MSTSVDSTVAELIGKDLTMSRDYASIINWSVDKIAKWTSSWTDFSITDPGILFANADAYMYDLLNYRLDQSYLNNILRYTKSLESLYFMANFVGLELPAYNCSTASVQIYNPYNFDLTIPKGFPVYVYDSATGKELWFYSVNEYQIVSRSSKTEDYLEGKHVEINTEFKNFDDFNRFVIPTDNIGINTVQVFAVLGKDTEFTELLKVKDAFLNTSSDMCFSVHSNYKQTVIKLPPGSWEKLGASSKIRIIYGIPSGTDGNVGELNALPGEKLIYNNIELQGELKIKILGSDGATEPYSLEDTRVYIGNNSWRVDTLVTTADFNNLAGTGNKFENIIRFVTKQGPGEEVMNCFFLPKTTLSLKESQDLTEEVKEYCQPFMFGGTKLEVSEIGYQKVSLSFEVTLGTNASNLSKIRAEIEAILQNYFDRNTQKPRMTIRRSYMNGLIEDGVKEVDVVSCTSPSSDMSVDDVTIFILGTITLKFIQKG